MKAFNNVLLFSGLLYFSAMIEIRDANDPKDKKARHLFIDGGFVEHALTRATPEDYIEITVTDGNASSKLAEYSLSEFPGTLGFIILKDYPDDIEHLSKNAGVFIGHDGIDDENTDQYYLSFTLGESVLPEWRFPYSFADYVLEMYGVLRARDDIQSVSIGDTDSNPLDRQRKYNEDGSSYLIDIEPQQIDRRYIFNLDVVFPFSSPTTKIKNEVNRVSIVLKRAHEEVLSRLTSHTRNDSIVKSFSFPKEVTVACEQYLLYFVQFLRDLGVEATSEIKQEAGRVLFTVTPTDKNEALHKIRVALDEYLHLPFSPVSSDTGNEIAVQRLESTVLRLQSDLRLASAELQARNATIEAQQLTINVQKGLLSGEIGSQLKDITPNKKDEDREEFFDGAAALTVLKKEGFELNLPKIYRRLKDWFADKE